MIEYTINLKGDLKSEKSKENIFTKYSAKV